MGRDLTLRAAIIALALLGIAVSAYLLYEHTVAPIACLTGSGCALVDQSPYSEIYGIPLSVLGLTSYVLILVLELGGLRAGNPHSSYLHLGVFGLALAGTLFSAYLTYLELWVIYAVCSWCVTSAVLITLILGLAALQLRGLPASEASHGR